MTTLTPSEDLVAHFAADIDALIPRDTRLGVAVSGGPDSLALLLLSAAARPGTIEAATVDHGLRAESADEAAMVERICGELGIPHRTLLADWPEAPTANVQAEARSMRYRLLNEWAIDRGLAKMGLGRAHHRALYFIARKPDMTVSELLSLLAITKQSLGRVLGELADRGLVETRPGAGGSSVRLTAL